MKIKDTFKVACVQMTSSHKPAINLKQTLKAIEQAACEQADLILLPENTNIMDQNKKRLFAQAPQETENPFLSACCTKAQITETWVLTGSLIIKTAQKKLINRSYLINPHGHVTAEYNKIHMFDVDLENGESYRESALYQPGNQAVVTHTPWGKIGLTICYDLRFPHLFRTLAKAGACFISVPAAFTVPTGKAHWHTLLRARAIETGCYIFAPAQSGSHEGGRKTYGHSLIIDPWGEVLADAGTERTIITAVIDPAVVTRVRRMIPALNHDRSFTLSGENTPG